MIQDQASKKEELAKIKVELRESRAEYTKLVDALTRNVLPDTTHASERKDMAYEIASYATNPPYMRFWKK